jgi:hypothetical protein
MRYFGFQLSYSVLIPQLFWSQHCYSGLNSGISFLDEVFRFSTQLFCVYPSVIRPTCLESRVGIPGAPGRLVDDLKTEISTSYKLTTLVQHYNLQPFYLCKRLCLDVNANYTVSLVAWVKLHYIRN